jgi:hypothetical protein
LNRLRREKERLDEHRFAAAALTNDCHVTDRFDVGPCHVSSLGIQISGAPP